MDTRDERVIELRRAGRSLQEIGDEFGFTRERARQILAQYGITGLRPHPPKIYRLGHLSKLHRAVLRWLAESGYGYCPRCRAVKDGEDFMPGWTPGYYCRACNTERRRDLYHSRSSLREYHREYQRRRREAGEVEPDIMYALAAVLWVVACWWFIWKAILWLYVMLFP